MEVLARFILNTIKILVKKKNYIIMGIIVPAFVIVFFTFEFDIGYDFRVGVIDKDKSYVSQEIINTIDEMEDVEIVYIKEKDYETLLITQQIQMIILINDNFQEKLLNLENEEIHIKSIKESDVKALIESMIKLKIDDMITLAKLSNKDINKFKLLYEDYKDQYTILSLNDVEEKGPSIEKSIGLVILMTFIIGGNIANHLIGDEENNTKIRILSSEMSKWKYYLSIIIVFYLMSCITSIIYYFICILFEIDLGMNNTINFLVVMLLLNLLSMAINLLIVSLSKSRHTSRIMNILIIVPCCILSGAFWDFDVMPSNLQKIGEFIPIRWVYICIEKLQVNESLVSAGSYMRSIVLLSCILIIISIFNLRKNKNCNKK